MANTRTGAIANSATSTVDEDQLAAIGGRRRPDGWWEVPDGNGGWKKLSHKDADALVNAAGAGVGGQEAWGSGRGWLGDTYDRNQKWLDPVLTATAGVVNPALGAAMAAGLKYGKQHNIGDALKAGVTSYGVGKLAGGLGKLPGAQSVQNFAAKIPGVEQLGKFGTAVGQTVKGLIPQGKLPGAQGVQDVLAGLAPKGSGGIGDFLGGIAGAALPIAQGINATDLLRKETEFANRALGTAETNWKDRAPLRTQGMAGLLKPQPVDLAGLDAQRMTGNAFARPALRPQPVG